ncbi:LuxR C-terminal-related transcriptional regulator [Microbacterium sp. NPDC058389]|uniref:helix-turn-helix transcriptional regulator n=1 Tax=Microbacterium sp. NPDC058389 TaxID=3346475 RepID=UPI0036583AC9
MSFSTVDGVVRRERLSNILSSPLVRACIVQGPSGSGKTTLLRSWATLDHSGTMVWVSLASGIASRQTFWQHVASTLARAGELPPDVAVRVKEQLAACVDPVQIATGLLRGQGEVTLVLEAYEHLAGAIPQVDGDLRRLLSAAPELRLVVATRANTSLVEYDPPDGRAVRVVTSPELALTVDEVQALLAELAGIDDPEVAASVVAATGGFALTVRAVVLAMAQLGGIPRLDSIEWDSVVTARMESLLPDAEAIAFVTDTSVPPYFDVDVASRLSGHPDVERILAVLEHNGFGRWIPYTGARPFFQYVDSVRDAFRARATTQQDRFQRLCVLSAEWLLAQDEIDQALQLAIEAEDYAFADRIFVSLVIQNPDSYITDRFLPTLQGVPEAVLHEHPVLAFGLGLALDANPLLRHDAPRAFRIVVESSASPSYLSPELDAFSLMAMRAVASRIAFDFHGSAAMAQSALALLEAVPADIVAEHGEHVGTTLRQLSFSLLQAGHIDDAVATASRSVSACTSQTTRNYSVVYAAGASAFAGDMGRAQAFLASVDPAAWPEGMRRSYLSALAVVTEGYRLLDAMDPQGAADVLLETDAYTPTSEFWPYFTAISLSARVALGQGVAEAERVAAELAGPTPPGVGDNVSTDHLHAVLARAFLLAGDRRTAGRVLDGCSPERAQLAAARIARLIADDQGPAALALARSALDLADHTPRTKADTRAVSAVAALRCGDPELAWAWLNAAVSTWETLGPRAHVAMLGSADRLLLQELATLKGSRAATAYLDVPLNTAPPPNVAPNPLTSRELVVIRAVDTHESVREVAKALVVSPHTIKSQLQSIYRKLQVSSRHAAVAVARERGLLDVHPDR